MVSEDVRLNLDQTNVYLYTHTQLILNIVQQANSPASQPRITNSISFHSIPFIHTDSHCNISNTQIQLFIYLFISCTSNQRLVKFNHKNMQAVHPSCVFVSICSCVDITVSSMDSNCVPAHISCVLEF